MKKKLAKAFDAMTFPVFHQGLELFNSFDALFTGDGDLSWPFTVAPVVGGASPYRWTS